VRITKTPFPLLNPHSASVPLRLAGDVRPKRLRAPSPARHGEWRSNCADGGWRSSANQPGHRSPSEHLQGVPLLQVLYTVQSER
jgi:hypothetical protein